MTTFEYLIYASPQISDKLIGLEEILVISTLVFVFAAIPYGVYTVFEYFINEHKRRSLAPWIVVMEAQTDEQLKKDLGKLISDHRLPSSYFEAKTENLDDRYNMVDDFMRICRKRKIKE